MAPRLISYEGWQDRYRQLYLDRLLGDYDLESLTFHPLHLKWSEMDAENPITLNEEDKRVVDRFVRLSQQIYALALAGTFSGENPVANAQHERLYFFVGFADRVISVGTDGALGIITDTDGPPQQKIVFKPIITVAEVDLIFFLIPFVVRILKRMHVEPVA
jgi:hypothetical protein